MFNEDEHQKPIHKLFYLITGTCNCGVRIRAPKAQRSAADEYTELMEADYYQDMPILPTSEH